ncbi:MAG: endonuclease III [Myxococcales bacterium]|nr:endonuclease III [Myxococcales bacterium]
MSGVSDSQRHVLEVRKRLRQALPEPRCELEHDNAWQLLVATILSAQSTDARVNQVTPELFRAYPTPGALADAQLADVERLVRTTGFFRNKAKAIVGASRVLEEEHAGEVPRTLEALVRLPGVARKTANVVLGTAYGLATGFIVDTHAGRVARRLALTTHDDAKRVEQDLCAAFAREDWIDMGHRFVLHGRYVCQARSPRCPDCPLQEVCPSATAEAAGTLAERAARERDLVGAG